MKLQRLLSLILFQTVVMLTIKTEAQVNLLPSIGISSLPSDSDPVCYIPIYTGGFDNSGIQVGDTASDFKLYSLSGDSVQLSSLLGNGKPVLMIAGSYTCPVFRGKVPSINNVINTYGNQVQVIIIYTVEAHPDIDTSVYFGFVNTTSQNISAGILYRQPVTYGERKAVVLDMLDSMTIQAPVYIDGPCNNWWSHYGPAPNNAYLINTNGVVFAKHSWYDKYPDNILCDIDSLLGNPTSCGGGGSGGIFSFNLVSNDTLSGLLGSTITFTGDLVNNSQSDQVVDVYRLMNNLPSGWESSLCIDICYPTTTDSATVLLPAQSTTPFHFYMYALGVAGMGKARIGFRNHNNPNNQTFVNLFGIADNPTGMEDVIQDVVPYTIYPNPTSSDINIGFYLVRSSGFRMVVTDLTGKMIVERNFGELSAGVHNIRLSTRDFPGGVCLVKLFAEGKVPVTRKLFVTR